MKINARHSMRDTDPILAACSRSGGEASELQKIKYGIFESSTPAVVTSANCSNLCEHDDIVISRRVRCSAYQRVSYPRPEDPQY